MKQKLVFTFIAGALLSACAATPQTAAEYRKAVNEGGFGASLDSYEVNRPYSKVAATLKSKAHECLDTKLVETTCINNSCKDRQVIYTPTVVTGPRKTEIDVQWKRIPEDAIFLGGQPPAKGAYIAVIDATPVGKAKTKLNVYAPKMVFTQIPKAVRHWADGSNLGCPNFSQGN